MTIAPSLPYIPRTERPDSDLQRATVRFGGLYLVAVFLSSSLLWGLAGTDPIESAIGKVFLLAAAALLAALLTALLIRLQALALPVKSALCFVLSLVGGVLYCLIDYVIYIVCVYPEPAIWDNQIAAYVMIHGTSLFFGWSCLFLALSYSFELRDRERRLAQMREEAMAAQMRALRYQLNPHFLFNTLNSMAGLIEEGERDDARDMVLSLSAYLRTTLALDPLQDLLLEEEIALQAGYLAIERRRFSDRMRVEIDVPEALREVLVPSLILQPLVENAVKHGAGRKTGSVAIVIRARAEAGRLRLDVENDMAGGDPLPGSESFGIGLKNVGERLSRRFPGVSGLDYGRTDDGRFRVTLTMPFRTA
ncbi:histidine kinase [Shinella sp. CPCC 100929]|uniref:Histidine kinase n=1 Tax=Shinella lacus TaxID=2654216 RepID=A0ABT1R2L0_9HYPH|nr:histidine kinase [Shinella lacus]MCQ4629401.1 histidine kinase [Shinella lacus]